MSAVSEMSEANFQERNEIDLSTQGTKWTKLTNNLKQNLKLQNETNGVMRPNLMIRFNWI